MSEEQNQNINIANEVCKSKVIKTEGDDTTLITVIDSPPGTGKTSYMIQQLNEAPLDTRFIIITPFLKEVARIKESCTTRKLYEPTSKNKNGSKLESLKKLISEGRDIVSTHALFLNMDDELAELISDGGYTLILDEVAEIIKLYNITKRDWIILLNENLIKIKENNKIEWQEDDYVGEFNWVKDLCIYSDLFLHSRTMDTDGVRIMVWTFPVTCFKCFDEVLILTYMYEAQMQDYYFEMYNISITLKMITKENDKYKIIDFDEEIEKQYKAKYKELIHIYEGNLNAIGNPNFSLSSTWLKTKTDKVKLLKNNTVNYFINITKSPGKNNLWTTIKGIEYENGTKTDSVKTSLSGKGYTKGFIACNSRATNDYADRHTVAYLLNLFMNPMMKAFFIDKGVEVDEDIWATSELVQFLFRSAIRNNEEINLYIPSKRMRNLLINWLGEN